MGATLKAILTASDKATPVIRGALAASDDLTKKAFKGLDALDKLQSKIAGSIKSTISTLSVAGLALGAVGGRVIMTGADFEEAMSGVAAVSGATGEQFEILKKKALELGTTTKYSSTEVAGAMEIMAKAGMGVNDVMSGLPGILSAAAADGASVEDTATSLMAAMKSLGLGPESLGLLADQFAKAGDSTAASIGSLSQSMAIFGPVVKQLKIPVESATAQIAILQDAGIDASSAGTTLAASYSKLAAPMGRTKEALKKLGIEVADAQGNFKMPDVLLQEILRSTGKIKGNVGKMAAFTELVGLESQKALLNIADAASTGKLDQVVASLNDAAGYADKLAAKRLNNLKGDFGLLMSSVDGVAQSLFGLESGALRGVVQGTREWVDANKEWIALGVDTKIQEWTPLVENFGDGLSDAFTDIEGPIRKAGNALGLFGDGAAGSRTQAYGLGNDVANLGFALVGITAASKLASFATWGLVAGTKAARFAGIALEGTLTAVKWAMVSHNVWTKASIASTWQLVTATGSVTGLLIQQRAAALWASGGLLQLAKTTGAAAAAAYALYKVNEQNEALKNETGGKGILDVGWEWATTNKGLKEIADENLDKQAKARAAERDAEERPGGRYRSLDLGGFSTEGLADAAGRDVGIAEIESLNRQLGMLNPRIGTAETMGMAPPPAGPPMAPPAQGVTKADVKDAVKQSLEITVKAPPDTAEVTKRPAGSKIKTTPSGAD